MPELVVQPADLVVVGHSMADVADRLDAVSAALPGMSGEVGPKDIAHALEDAAHVWQSALGAVAVAVDAAAQRLVSAASAYDAVETMVSDWAGR